MIHGFCAIFLWSQLSLLPFIFYEANTEWQQRQLRLVQCFFYWWILTKFQPEKYDFDLHNGFFMRKVNGPNSPDFVIQKFEIARVLRWLPEGSQEDRRILCFFLPSYLLCSQIWLNYFLDDYHFGYITKSLKETLEALVKVFGGTCSEPSCEKLLLQLDALLAISLVVVCFQLWFNLIFSGKIIQYSRTFAPQVQTSWNQADAPLLPESFPKRPRTRSEASRFSGSRNYKTKQTNYLAS